MLSSSGARRILRILAVASVATIVVLSVVPAEVRPHVVRSGDAEHFAAYLVSGFLLAGAFPRLKPWRGVVALAVLAAALEGVQTMVPGRHAGLVNWLASSAGGAAGFGLEALAVRLVPLWRRLTQSA